MIGLVSTAVSSTLLTAALAGKVLGAGISGQVTCDGKPVTGAWVQLNTGLLTVTDARGRYSFPQLSQVTYALQVFVPAKEPVIMARVVPGKGRADCTLETSEVPRGLVHLKATAVDGSLCPIRIITRWRADEGAEWTMPPEVEYASTLDGQGQPFVPSDDSRRWLVPEGACLWTSGDAVLALPPGQAELTCTSGVLMRAAQQIVEVKPNEVAEVAVSMTLASELRAAGWTNGAIGVQVSDPDGLGEYLTNVPLAAAICRAEGFDWVVLSPPYGNDPNQANVGQAIAEARTDRFGIWASPQVPTNRTGERMVAVAVEPPTLPHAPGSYLARLLQRGILVYDDLFGNPFSRGLLFDLIADPQLSFLLDVAPGELKAERSLEFLGLLISQGGRLGLAALAKGTLDRGQVPIPQRTFVQTNRKIDLAEIVIGLRKRATFVTAGPVLSLAIGEAEPGGILPADDQTQLAELDAVLGCVPGEGITRLELLRNGQVVRSWDVPNVSPNRVQVSLAIRENRSAWFALRASGLGADQVACSSPIFFADPEEAMSSPTPARISGQVTDAVSGAAIAGARITATLPGHKPSTSTTGPDGRYRLDAPVTAMIEVSHPGYPRREATTSLSDDRVNATVKFVAWDCEQVRAALDQASPEDLLSAEFLEHLRRLLTAPIINFRLRAR